MNKVPDILRKIVAAKRREVALLAPKLKEFQAQARKAAPALAFGAALRRPGGLSVIAEIKKASPSAGLIADAFAPRSIAAVYQQGGADAVSVLTDTPYFQGKLADLQEVRAIVKIPILRKDFIIHPVQIYEARAAGADSFLLIAAILTAKELQNFLELGRELGMEPLVEVHDHLELDKVLNTDAKIIGVNNRDLHSFRINLNTAATLFPSLPPDVIKVAESGITSPADARRLRQTGFDAILVGQSLMTTGLDMVAEKIAGFKHE